MWSRQVLKLCLHTVKFSYTEITKVWLHVLRLLRHAVRSTHTLRHARENKETEREHTLRHMHSDFPEVLGICAALADLLL